MADDDRKGVFESLERVTDEATFLVFLATLADDRLDEVEREKVAPSSPWGSGANGWENGTIEAFLERASEWGRASSNGLRFYSKPANPWRRCADILYAGKIYE